MTEITLATAAPAASVDAVVGHVEDVSAISAQTASAAGDVTGAVDEQERTLGAVETAAESLSDRAAALRGAVGDFEFDADDALAGAAPDGAAATATAVSDGGTAGAGGTDFDFSHGDGGTDDVTVETLLVRVPGESPEDVVVTTETGTTFETGSDDGG
jgi:methyl-accepting chemotaxis protein